MIYLELPGSAEESPLAFFATILKGFFFNNFIEVNIIANYLNSFQFFFIADDWKKIKYRRIYNLKVVNGIIRNKVRPVRVK